MTALVEWMRPYASLPADVLRGVVAPSHEIRAMLLDRSYDFDPAHTADEAMSYEIADGGGYARGGRVCSAARVAGGPDAAFLADNPAEWEATDRGFSFRWVLTLDYTSGALIGCNDYGKSLRLRAGDTFAFSFDEAGVFTVRTSEERA